MRTFIPLASLVVAMAPNASAGSSERIAARGAESFVEAAPQAFAFKAAGSRLPCDEPAAGRTEKLACELLMKNGMNWKNAPGYKMLELLYSEGAAPTPGLLKGWWAGRRFLFDPSGKGIPPSAILQGFKTVEGDGGPLTGPLYKMRMFLGLSSGQRFSPESVDSIAPESIKAVRENGPWGASSLPKFLEKEAVYTSSFDWEDGLLLKEYSVRRFGSWIVVRFSDPNRFGGVDRSFYAYFFKNVTPASERD